MVRIFVEFNEEFFENFYDYLRVVMMVESPVGFSFPPIFVECREDDCKPVVTNAVDHHDENIHLNSYKRKFI